MKNIQIGNTIRSLDFPGRDDCYMVGTVTAIDTAQGLIHCDLKWAISEGKLYEPQTDTFSTPITHIFEDMFDHADGRLFVIDHLIEEAKEVVQNITCSSNTI